MQANLVISTLHYYTAVMSSDIQSSDSVLSLYVQNRPVPHDTLHTTQHYLNILLLSLFTRYISRIIQSCICALCHFMTADIVYCSYFLYGVRATDHCQCPSVRLEHRSFTPCRYQPCRFFSLLLWSALRHPEKQISCENVDHMDFTLLLYERILLILVFLYYVLHKSPQFLYTAAEIMTSPLLSLNWTWWEHWFSFFTGYRV